MLGINFLEMEARVRGIAPEQAIRFVRFPSDVIRQRREQLTESPTSARVAHPV